MRGQFRTHPPQRPTAPHRRGVIAAADAQHVLEILQRDSVSFSAVAEVIQRSPGLSELVVRLARAAAHGLRSQPATVEHSVGVLGLQRLRDAVAPHAERGAASEAA